MLTPQRVIDLLGLEPLPIEGGYFRQTYRAADSVAREALPARYTSARLYCGAIYYLLHGDDFSALHRLQTDEIYHHYLGQPVELLLLFPDGHDELHTLGPNLEAGQRPQLVAPRGAWQGSRLAQPAADAFTLLGTTMAPAYEQDDFELGERDTLIQRYPKRTELIRALTR